VKVAVIVAAYQAKLTWLVDCLDSIADSATAAGVKYDLRLGVDGCATTECSMAVLAVPHHVSDVNVGPYVMRNSLIALAPADVFVIFDADDVMLPGYFRTVLVGLGRHALIGPSRIECDEHLAHIEHRPYKHGVCAFRSEVLERLGGFKAERLGADVDFIARARTAGIVPYVTKEPCYLRRRHGASLTKHPQTGKASG
jgi:glycosyltransferase involved in cell wall biosynthesis